MIDWRKVTKNVKMDNYNCFVRSSFYSLSPSFTSVFFCLLSSVLFFACAVNNCFVLTKVGYIWKY